MYINRPLWILGHSLSMQGFTDVACALRSVACKADSNTDEIEEDLWHVLRMLREAVLAKIDGAKGKKYSS